MIGRIHVGIIFGIGLGPLGGVVVIARNVFSLVRKAETFVIGASLTRAEAPQLWSCVDLLSEPERKEKEISGTYQAILAQHLGIDLKSRAGGQQESGS